MTEKSAYQKELLRVRSCKCPGCDGFGIQDQMIDEYDELAYSEWTCPECNGTGFLNGQYTCNIVINKPKVSS